jgi:DNA replication protein DnaC
MTEEQQVLDANDRLLALRRELGIREDGIPDPIRLTSNLEAEARAEKNKVWCSRHETEKPCAICHEEHERHLKAVTEEWKQREQAEREAWERKQNPYRADPESALEQSDVPKLYIHCSLDNFEGGEELKELCRKFIADKACNGLVLSGGSGNGKTHIAVATLRELIRTAAFWRVSHALFVSAPELLLDIRHSFRDESISEKELVDKYANVPNLILDDLGAEKATDYVITTLYTIINRRYSNALRTIFTTNLSIDQIEEHLGCRIASRMASAKIVHFEGSDYRLKRNA